MPPISRRRLHLVLAVPILLLCVLAGCRQDAASDAAVEPVAEGVPVETAQPVASGAARAGGAAPDSLTASPAQPQPSSTPNPVPVEPPPPSCPAPDLAGAAPVRISDRQPPAVAAATGVVIDAASGAVLWGLDEHRAVQPASVSKIVTALLAVERGNLDTVITVDLPQQMLSRGSTMGLVTGDWFTLRDLLYGLMLPSGNDAAAVIATHLAGSEPAFAEQMNQRLCDLGLTDSHFINASGLGRGMYNMASAYDLAQVSRAAMQHPAFVQIAGTRAWTARGSRVLAMSNLNQLIGWYPGADGIKIGWTPGAGNTIVGSATRNGHRVIVVLLNTPDRAGESAALLNWAFANHRWE